MKLDRTTILPILVLLGIKATDALLQIIDYPGRQLILIGGWRAGKSVALAIKIFLLMFAKCLAGERGLFWLVGPDYPQCREEFRYIKEWSYKLGLVEALSDPNEGPKSLTLRGGVVLETKSAQHEERLASVAPDAIGLCEAGQCSEATYVMLLGRTAEKRAPLYMAGTLEDDEAKQYWAWYQKLAMAWMDGKECREGHDCVSEHQALSLPSWANLVVFPGGEQDPEIIRLKGVYDPYTFARRIAAIPTGVQYAIYHQAIEKEDKLLRAMTEAEMRQPVLATGGGIDYGTTIKHPSVLTVGHLLPDPRDAQPNFVGPRGILWVRECTWLEGTNPGDATNLQRARKSLSERWRCYRWNLDPNERYMAKSFQGEATSYSESAREARVGIVQARFNLDKIMFDLNGPGVPKLYEQFKRVHRREQKDGKLVYVRMDDDGVASCEDMVEIFDGRWSRGVPKPTGIKKSAMRVARSIVRV